jgi:RNA recognition motif-containing protein
MVGDNTSHIPGVNIQSSLHDKKLFISGLPKISTEPQVELRRAELERAFRKYGGALGVTVTCPPNCSFAFVEVESYRAADMAIREMSSKYTVNRARRSRHDALMEQRESAEAGNTKSNDDGDWN